MEDVIPVAEATLATIGRCQVRRELGRGAMGVVCEGNDPVLARPVAVKTIHKAFSADKIDGQVFERRIFVEARTAAGLSHPVIVVVYDVGRDVAAGRLYRSSPRISTDVQRVRRHCRVSSR